MTELSRHMTKETLEGLQALRGEGEMPFQKSVPQGAATTVYAATNPALDDERVWFFEDCAKAQLTDDPLAPRGVRAYALDPDRAEALWSLSEELVDAALGGTA
jgi:hypothetical protein